MTLLDPWPGVAGTNNVVQVINAQPGVRVFFCYGEERGRTNIPGCPDMGLSILNAKVASSAIADDAGSAKAVISVPDMFEQQALYLQAISRPDCIKTGRLRFVFD